MAAPCSQWIACAPGPKTVRGPPLSSVVRVHRWTVAFDMIDLVQSGVSTAWKWARENDLPNWLVFAFTVVLWPLVLILWQRRKVNGVPGLEVHFADGNIVINGAPHAAIDIQFTNHTGSVAYVSGVRIVGFTDAFPIPIEASRDRAENSYHLKFIDDKGEFKIREVTLQTSAMAKTCMPVANHMADDFFSYAPSWWARKLHKRRYFAIEYTAMVGTARYSVATVY